MDVGTDRSGASGGVRERGPTEGHVTVRAVEAADAETWLELRDALWPDSGQEHAQEIAAQLEEGSDSVACYVAELPGEGVVGFAEVGLRGYAEGCRSTPVGYLEGIYVAPRHRGRGTGRCLVSAAEAWARARGCTEMASDREIDNEVSASFHEAVGYAEVERIVCYRKDLS